jgi:predicted Holliday junction resolvase-like endonuclease
MIAAFIIVALIQFGVVFLTIRYIHLLKKSIKLRDDLLENKQKEIVVLTEASDWWKEAFLRAKKDLDRKIPFPGKWSE